MTMLDKLRELAPDLIGEEYQGGVAVCPEDLDFEEKTKCLCLEDGQITVDKCMACWSRELPEGAGDRKSRR